LALTGPQPPASGRGVVPRPSSPGGYGPAPVATTRGGHGLPGKKVLGDPGAWIVLAFSAFLFSLLFEDAAIGPIEPTTVTGLLFLLAALTRPAIAFRAPRPAVVLFMVFVYVSIPIGLMLDVVHTDAMIRKWMQFGYLVVLLWVASNLLSHERVARAALLALGSGSLVLALLQLSGVAARPWTQGVGSRVTALGFHPNHLAVSLAVGALALVAVGMVLAEGKSAARIRWAALGGAAAIGAAMVQTGSRGGLIALVLGLAVLSLQPGRGRPRMLVMAAVLAIGIGLMAYLSESTRTRFEATVGTGNMARREQIFPIAAEMVAERPWFGYGLAENTYELGSRFEEEGKQSKDTHNFGLYLLTGVGIVGTIPFLAGIVLAVGAAWRGRSGVLGAVPLSLLACQLAAAMGLTLIQTKLFWIVVALAVAAPLLVRTRSESGEAP
jgi:O-antigen ligase